MRGGHWGVNLRMQWGCLPWEKIESLLERADRLSAAADTPCKKAGGNQYYHSMSVAAGRGAMISFSVPHKDGTVHKEAETISPGDL